MPMNFTLVHSGKTNDESDDAGDVAEIAVTGWLHFVAQIPEGQPALAPDEGDTGTSYWVRTFKGYLDTDGVLKNEPGGTPGVRIWANDPLLNLERLPYLVFAPNDLRANGKVVEFDPFVFDAPPNDVVKKFSELQPVPSATAQGLAQGPRGYGLTGNYLGTSVNEAAMFAKVGAVGDWTIRTDTFSIWVVVATPSSSPDNWVELQYPVGATAFARLLLGANSSAEAMAVLGEDAISDAIALAAPALVSAAVTSDIAGRDILEAGDPRALQFTYIPDIGLVVHDAARRILFMIAGDGSTKIARLDMASIPVASITAAKLATEVATGLVPPGVGTIFSALPPESGYHCAVWDSKRRILWGLKLDGTMVGRVTLADGQLSAAKLDSALAARIPPSVWSPPLVPEVSGTTPNRKLWALNHTTGVRTLITDVNDPHDAVEDNGAILFTDTGGRKAYTASGLIIPAYPDRSVINACGDSLTQGWFYPFGPVDPSSSWPAVLDPLISASVVNTAISGQSSDEIALRQGGYVLNLTVAGGSIPTSGAVTVTTTQGFGFRYDRAWSQLGTLAGVPGTLSRTSSDAVGTMHFTRTSSGTAVAVAGATPFTSADAITHESHPVIIFMARNDIYYNGPTGIANTDPITRSVAAHDAMVARLRAYHKEFLILGTTTATNESTASTDYTLTGYQQVTAINAALAAKYGNRFVDVRHYLATQCIYDLGITPTTADLAAMAADTLPPSIMSGGDVVHYSQATAAKVATAVVKPKLDQMGYAA